MKWKYNGQLAKSYVWHSIYSVPNLISPFEIVRIQKLTIFKSKNFHFDQFLRSQNFKFSQFSTFRIFLISNVDNNWWSKFLIQPILAASKIRSRKLSQSGFSKKDCLHLGHCEQYGNYINLLSQIFGKNFVKVMLLSTRIYFLCFYCYRNQFIMWLISQQICVRENFTFFHTVL